MLSNRARRTFYPITRCLEIVSEDARHLPESTVQHSLAPLLAAVENELASAP
jgi:hypothetical protein